METNLDRKTRVWIFLMKLGALTGCHQLYERSFRIKGYQFPVCARCTGIVIGEIAGMVFQTTGYLFSLGYEKYSIDNYLIPAALSISILAFDGLGQLYGYWVSNNLRRIVTGLICGFFMMCLVIVIIKYIINF